MCTWLAFPVIGFTGPVATEISFDVLVLFFDLLGGFQFSLVQGQRSEGGVALTLYMLCGATFRGASSGKSIRDLPLPKMFLGWYVMIFLYSD